MSLNSDETPTGPIPRARQAPPGPPGARPAPPGPPGARPAPPGPHVAGPPQTFTGPPAPGHLTKRRNNIRDLTAAVLLVLAPLFPWNLYFGLLIPGSSVVLWGILLAVTLLSLIALAASRANLNPVTAGKLRLALNLPYLLLVAAFVVYDVFESIKSGGTVHVAGGVGPGGWLGIAGALLSAQPLLIRPTTDEASYYRWVQGARVVGYASMFGASLTAGFNLCWRVRYALQGAGGSEAFGTRNIAVILTAVVYGVVALTAVVVASRWILRNNSASRFFTLALGTSSMVAGILVWVLPAGREIDAFHGIAQNTSTAGVGYEGYLAWAAAAALFAPLTLFSSPETRADREIWRGAIRKALVLIIVWSLGSVLMRITDFVVAVMLNYPYSRYDTMTLAVFDAFTAGLAFWLHHILGSQDSAQSLAHTLRSRPVTAFGGLLFALTVSRVVLGVLLAPRFEQTPGAPVNPVYGNNLAQQITSTFDVTLCGLALFIVVAVVIAGRIRKPRRRPRRQRPVHTRNAGGGAGPNVGPGTAPNAGPNAGPPVPVPPRPTASAPPSQAKTAQFRIGPTEHDAPTSVLSGPRPRIFRSGETTGPLRPKIFRPPNNPS